MLFCPIMWYKLKKILKIYIFNDVQCDSLDFNSAKYGPSDGVNVNKDAQVNTCWHFDAHS